ncbi:MAG: LigA, partial [Verrucomicrobiaceae bacterium]|nr:LigA [Verrucomicrobiaceae bacterium]
MTLERFQQIESQGGIIDLGARAKFRFTGGDRVRYLNGQVTNDVRKASPTETLYACVTDAKGRIAGDVFVHASQQGDALLVDAEPSVRDTLGPRLEKYIIADDVELTDVTDDWHLWHVFGSAAAAFTPGANGVLKSHRLGLEGVDIWRAAGKEPPAAACAELSAAEHETLRVLSGIPRHPNELNGDTFPPEAGVEDRAMSYTKGCYIGQEILSRIRTTGKMPRELVQWRGQGRVSAGE